MNSMKLTKSEELAIELLKKAERHWPESLWIFAEDGRLHIMKSNNDGEHAIDDATGAIDQRFIIDTINIDSDGGGW